MRKKSDSGDQETRATAEEEAPWCTVSTAEEAASGQSVRRGHKNVAFINTIAEIEK